MRNIFTAIALLISITIFSQVHLGQAPTQVSIEPKYDSLTNQVNEDIYKEYLGQELYCLPAFYSWESVQNWAYIPKFNGHKTPFSPIGQYFEVVYISDTSIPKNDDPRFNKTWFKLKEKDNGRIVYYSYESGEFWHFIVIGYYTKMLDIYKGHDWYRQNDSVMKHDKWKCTDVIVDTSGKDVKYIPEMAVKLVLEKDGKKHFVIGGSRSIFPNTAAQLYGIDFNTILDGKVKIGWTKELVIASLGRPSKINTGIYQNGSTEQWVYYHNDYYYFDNDKLTAIQFQ